MTAIGVLNPNSVIKEYIRDLQTSSTNETKTICLQIADIVGDRYGEWWESAPDGNKEFLQYAKDTLAVLCMVEALKAALDTAYSNSITMNAARHNVERSIALEEEGAQWTNYEWAKGRLSDALNFEALL